MDCLEVSGMKLQKMTESYYLRSAVTQTGECDEAVKLYFVKARRKIIHLRPLLRSTRLIMSQKARLVEIFVYPIVIYGLATVVFRVKDNKRLLALQNTARRMILGLWSRRERRMAGLKEQIPLENLAACIQRRHFALWVSLAGDKHRNLISKILF